MSDQNSSFPTPPSDSSNVYAPPEARVDDVVPEGEIVLAERGTRLAAAIIDAIIMFFVAAMIGMAVGIGYFASGAGVGIGMQITIQVAAFIAYLLINGYWLAKNGQSVGKKLMGIRIVRADGSKCPIERIVALRLLPVWIAGAIPYIGAVISIVDALCIFRDSRQCLHDNIADTVVVKA